MKQTHSVSISKEKALGIYRKIYLARKCEEAIRSEYAKDQMKTPVHLSNGAEAIPACVLACLAETTKTFGTYRNHSLFLAVTENTDRFFGELYGRVTGCASGLAGSMHLTAPESGLFLTSAVVGTTIPPAVGASFADWYRNSGNYTAVFFGDGALEEGAFWESLNFACLKKLRILFVCENNELAIHAHVRDRQSSRSALSTVSAFDCHAAEAPGHLPQRIMGAARSVIEKMAGDPKPAFLSFDYFRYLEHVGVHEDFAAGYRSRPDEKTLREKDPLTHAGIWARSQGLGEEEITNVNRTVDAQIKQSIEKAKSAPFPSPSMLFEHVFSANG
ncbi:MAG: thiamine pyrophosphate-dependent dehydrogenase E1 component subunit alpha [Candidatus Omnitrophica bacterium]|nr:thiamine pyrophosphate-dependent dehydrogenase E1 component subunit alpha [Candidatus Omnitrophota bacterium]